MSSQFLLDLQLFLRKAEDNIVSGARSALAPRAREVWLNVWGQIDDLLRELLMADTSMHGQKQMEATTKLLRDALHTAQAFIARVTVCDQPCSLGRLAKRDSHQLRLGLGNPSRLGCCIPRVL